MSIREQAAEGFYNSVGPGARVQIILAGAKKEGQNVTPEAARAYAQLNYTPLMEFRSAGNQAFDEVRNPSASFQQTRLAIETATKTNGPAAQAAVKSYSTLGAQRYKDMLESLAANIQNDPGFAKHVQGQIGQNPANLQGLLEGYQAAFTSSNPRAVSQYIAANGGANPAAPAAAAPATATPGRKPANAPAAAANPAPAAPAAALTPEQQFQQFLKENPSLADLMRAQGLDKIALAEIRANPSLIGRFYDPGIKAKIEETVRAGTKDRFLEALRGSKLEVVMSGGGGMDMGQMASMMLDGLGKFVGQMGLGDRASEGIMSVAGAVVDLFSPESGRTVKLGRRKRIDFGTMNENERRYNMEALKGQLDSNDPERVADALAQLRANNLNMSPEQLAEVKNNPEVSINIYNDRNGNLVASLHRTPEGDHELLRAGDRAIGGSPEGIYDKKLPKPTEPAAPMPVTST